MSRALRVFVFFATAAFCLGALGFLVLHAVMPHGQVFAGLYRMYAYHEKHPLQYVAVVALTYALLATPCALRWGHLTGERRVVLILAVMGASVLVASAPGGVLWKIHDMQAGSFTHGARFWEDLTWGASTGLQVGWLVLALSMPYNLIGLIAGYLVTSRGFKIALPPA